MPVSSFEPHDDLLKEANVSAFSVGETEAQRASGSYP